MKKHNKKTKIITISIASVALLGGGLFVSNALLNENFKKEPAIVASEDFTENYAEAISVAQGEVIPEGLNDEQLSAFFSNQPIIGLNDDELAAFLASYEEVNSFTKKIHVTTESPQEKLMIFHAISVIAPDFFKDADFKEYPKLDDNMKRYSAFKDGNQLSPSLIKISSELFIDGDLYYSTVLAPEGTVSSGEFQVKENEDG